MSVIVMSLFKLKQVFSYAGLGSVLKYASVNAEDKIILSETFTEIKERIFPSGSYLIT